MIDYIDVSKDGIMHIIMSLVNTLMSIGVYMSSKGRQTTQLLLLACQSMTARKHSRQSSTSKTISKSSCLFHCINYNEGGN